MIATGLATAALYARYSIGMKIWSSKPSSIIQSSTGLAASGFMLLTASVGGKFTRNESLFDVLNLPFDTIFLMPVWIIAIILVIGLATTALAILNLRNKSAVQH